VGMLELEQLFVCSKYLT